MNPQPTMTRPLGVKLVVGLWGVLTPFVCTIRLAALAGIILAGAWANAEELGGHIGEFLGLAIGLALRLWCVRELWRMSARATVAAGLNLIIDAAAIVLLTAWNDPELGPATVGAVLSGVVYLYVRHLADRDVLQAPAIELAPEVSS